MNVTYNYFSSVNSLLKALGFQGKPRAIIEAAPHLSQHLKLEDLRELMANIGYFSQMRKIDIGDIPDHPGLLHVGEKIYLIYHADKNSVHMIDLLSNENLSYPKSKKLKGTFCYFYTEDTPLLVRQTWTSKILHRFGPEYRQLLFIGLFNSIFALTIPLFIRSVFDWAIEGRSSQTLAYLIGGFIIALIAHGIIHTLQNRSLTYVGARMNHLLSVTIVEKILKLPLAHIEQGAVSDQITRIKQIDSIRDFFTSPLAQLFLEAPFFIFFLIALTFLGGNLVIIPIILAIIFAMMIFFVFPLVKNGIHRYGSAYQERFSFLVETFYKLNMVKLLGGEKNWCKKFEEKNFYYSQTSSENSITNAYVSNISQILIKAAGFITIIWGTLKVIDGEMTVGSLIAVVLLIWRALSPMQSAFLYLGNIDMTMDSIKKINNLMDLETENYAPGYISRTSLKGHIMCNSLAFRYPGQNSLVLRNITMEIHPGEHLGIIGGNGIGKSTVMKLLLGFYQPSAGTIYFDNIDFQQIPPNLLRQMIGYAPQQTQFFHGTILQNFLLVCPDASMKNVKEACDDAGVLKDIERLPQGFDTRMDDKFITGINAGFQQKLNLARAYVRNTKILLLDEPGSNLDQEADTIFLQKINMWKAKKTCIIITHRPSLIKQMDKLLVLEKGTMKFFGTTEDIISSMNNEQRMTA